MIIKISLTLLTLSFNACSLLNPVIGYERTFKWEMNKYVGQSVEEFFREKASIIERISEESVAEETVKFDVLLKYHSLGKGPQSCSIQVIANRLSRRIIGWQYLGNPSSCNLGYFYEGPW